MISNLKLLSLLADHTRLRLLAILEQQELSVAECQEVLNTGQSRISSHLSQLKATGILQSRRDGQRIFYRWHNDMDASARQLLDAALHAAREIPAADHDGKTLKLVLKKRQRQSLHYFNAIAGRLGKNYCPGRSWEAVGHLLVQLAEPLTVADLGAGEGLLSQMLALRMKKVIAVDISPRMVEIGAELARAHGLDRLEYRLGDLEDPPIVSGSVDLVILSQALHHSIQPQRALDAAFRILKKGGRICILDLNEHNFEKARELYADQWLGFSTASLLQMLQQAGFRNVSVALVSKEKQPPYFQTILATAHKP
ncbi:MAG: metalloregulator ArsR/SmtB family transcription factor [Verrucomicrobiales bacterium]|jgi:ArsR family transcriptional regulator|nr:metalloregulator ArsR/SmtB family transcription factor [Verrucomicrobiales bacterium]